MAISALRSGLRAQALSLALVSAGAHGQDQVRSIRLADDRMLSTSESRQVLKYLASCALPAKTILFGEIGGERFEFPGDLALASLWQERPMTLSERRWVSACMLARTNYYGVPVQISLRPSFPNSTAGLQTSTDEVKAFPREEGTFFGDSFAAPPVGYVCSSKTNAAARTRLLELKRVCTLQPDWVSGDAPGPTACGMRYVGACSPEAFTQDGVTYREAITVFLPQ